MDPLGSSVCTVSAHGKFMADNIKHFDRITKLYIFLKILLIAIIIHNLCLDLGEIVKNKAQKGHYCFE